MRRLIATFLLLFLSFVSAPHCMALDNNGRSDEITLEQIGGMINVRRRLVLKQDETFTFTEYLGDCEWTYYKGKIGGFNDLYAFIEANGFFKMKESYSAQLEDAGCVIVTVIHGSSQRRVEDCGGAGPVELWGIERAIWGMVSPYEWIKVKERNSIK